MTVAAGSSGRGSYPLAALMAGAARALPARLDLAIGGRLIYPGSRLNLLLSARQPRLIARAGARRTDELADAALTARASLRA